MPSTTEPIPAPAELHSLFEAAERRGLEHWRRGPTRMTWETLPPQTGDPAPDVRPLVDSIHEAAYARLPDLDDPEWTVPRTGRARSS